MKSLSEYIKENLNIENINEGSVKFNFDGMDNADDILKQLSSMQSASVNDKEVEVVCDANVDELNEVYDILKKYSDNERSGRHRTNDEQYAQKTIKFAEKVDELKEMIEKIETPDDMKSDDTKSDDTKSDDTKSDDTKSDDEKSDDKKKEKKEEE